MKKVKVVLGFLVIVLLLGGWSPMPPAPGLMSGNSAAVAASGDPELVVNNLTGAAFYMTMTGPQTYSVHVLAGKNTFIVAKGVYALSYFACGAQQAKEVNVKKSGASIKLTCDSAGKSDTGAVQLTITNKTGASFYITLTGTKTYTFNVSTGKSSFAVDQGVYDVSYFACGAQQTGSVNVKKKGGSMTIACEKTKTVAVTINNQMGGTLNLTLTGPATYSFSLPGGKTKVYIAKGTYNYNGWGPCGSASGTIDIDYKGTWTWWCK